ncbi:MAG TPA: hypothetical protein VF982_03450 [Anaerolineales bacterium]
MGIRPFSTGELGRLQLTQASAMQDEGQILAYSAGTADDYGLDSAKTYAAGQKWPCGFRARARREGSTHGESMNETEVGEQLSEVRLPLEAESELTTPARFKLLQRFGEILTGALTFEVVGLPERGPSGLVLRLRLVTDGSA